MKKAMFVWVFCALAVIASVSKTEAVQPMVAAEIWSLVGLKTDGTVVAVRALTSDHQYVDDWTDIIQLAVGCWHTVGLKSDGTVLAVGDNGDGQLNVDGWTDITQVAAEDNHTVGLKNDGTVVAVGLNRYGQLNVGGWTDITQVATGRYYTLGLKSNGTVVAVGDNGYGQLNMDGWTDITQVVIGNTHVVGLRSNGTVKAMGSNSYWDKLNVDNWTNITQVAAGLYHTVGLRSDGTVVAVGDNYFGQLNVGDWTNITQVAVEFHRTVGLKSDGTMKYVGWNNYLNVDDWNLNVGDSDYGIIEGQVAVASGNVEGVVVDLFFIGKVASTVTDADGYYHFENVAKGNYRVHVIPPEPQYPNFYLADVQLQQVSVRAETTSVVDFVLKTMDMNLNGDEDIDQEDIMIINYLRGEDASVCPNCDMDGDGTITGLDARKAVVQCTRPGCAVE